MEPENEILSAYTVVFDHLVHLGPGDSATTRKLVERLRPDLPSGPRIGDFGCGVGASALVLAQSLPAARVLALDSHAPFIARLKAAASTRPISKPVDSGLGYCRRDRLACLRDLPGDERAIVRVHAPLRHLLLFPKEIFCSGN